VKEKQAREIQSEDGGFQLFIKSHFRPLQYIWVISLSTVFAITPLEYNLQLELTTYLCLPPRHEDWCGV